MTTERDVYDIDTSGAQEGMEKLEKKTDDAKHAQEEFNTSLKAVAEEFKNNFAKQITTAQAQYELLKEAVREVAAFIKEGLHEWEEDAKSKARQGVILRNLGDEALRYRDRLEAQQKQIERNLGLDEAYVANLQNVVMGMGVSAQETERFTNAAVRLATLMGTDAVNAARLLSRAHAEGKEELKRFGIVAKEGQDLLAQVEERTRGISEAMPDYTRLVNEQAQAWGDFKKGVGGVSAAIWVFLNQDSIKMSQRLNEMKAAMEDARWMELRGIYAQHGVDIDYARGQMGHKAAGPEYDKESLDKDNAKAAEERRKAAADKKKEEDKYFLELAKGYYEEQKQLRDKAEKDAAASHEKFYKQQQKEAKDDADIEVATLDAFAEEEKAINAQRKEDAEKLARETKELEKKKADELKAIQQEILGSFKDFATQSMNLIASFVKESLTSNTKFNEKFKQYQLDRELITQKELGVNKSRAEMEKQLAEEAQNAQKARIADFLAGIAQQAGMKAILEAAEAIASAAEYDYGGAAMHAAAAAAFGAVAVATGGAAAAISSGRGMTTEERHQLESAEQEKRNRTQREADQEGQAAQSGRGPQINVYYLGLPGMTSAEMGKELERLNSDYDDLKTGGG